MLSFLKQLDDIEYYSYVPTLLRPYENCYPVGQEPNYWKRPVHRIRMFLEYFKTRYQVIYMRTGNETLGHLVVARGGFRLAVSTKEDIVIGPVWVAPQCRNLGLATKGISAVLHGLDITFRYAYEFIDKGNLPSIATVRKNGFSCLFQAEESGLLKIVREADHGRYLVFRYSSLRE